MTAIESLLLAYVANAAWQLPLLTSLALFVLRCLRRPSPRLEYGVWLLTVGLAAILPLSVGLGLFSPVSIAAPDSVNASLPDALLRVVLVVALLPSCWMAARLSHAAFATFQLRRSTVPLFTKWNLEVRQSPPDLDSAGPLLIGVIRPVVLVPGFLTSPEHASLLDAALAHEQAHVERHDLSTHLLSEVLLIPLTFHPSASWLRRQLHSSRELACDAEAKIDPLEYARCLLAITRHTIQPDRSLHALGVGGSQLLERRIHALAAPSTRTLSGRERSFSALLLFLACILLIGSARQTYLWLSSIPAPVPAQRSVKAPPPPPLPPQMVHRK